MQQLNDFLAYIDSFVSGSQWFVLFLVGTGLFFTCYLRFPQFRFFRRAFHIVSGKYDRDHHTGDTTHFQSLATALSGTVGTGNIAGVALAIHLGGPSALFWMMMTAFVGMATKMVEVTLSHKYREKTEDGTMAGGPMYYMKNKLKLPWLASLFAVCTIVSAFGTGCLPQSNSISNAMFAAFGIPHYLVGLVLALLIGFIIIGGIKRIARVTEKLVPFMSLIYLLGALSVIIYHYDNIIPAFFSIFSDVIDGTAATGGFLGASVAWAFNRGVNRGLFSNEAGQGSAPIAHAAARTEEPASEGMVALLEPFIDTICICFLTGLVLLSSGAWMNKFENRFQETDIVVLAGMYNEKNEQDRSAVAAHVAGNQPVKLYEGELLVHQGRVINSNVTFLHARSFAEETRVYLNQQLFTGKLQVIQGKIDLKRRTEGTLTMSGKSLLHSAPLTSQAFRMGFLGRWGELIVPLSLLLFAFSTAISWSYYGDRAVIFLWGKRYVKIYQVIFVSAFFLASFTDTTIIWTLSGFTVAMMTLPNLIGILLLRKDVKATIGAYTEKIKSGELEQ